MLMKTRAFISSWLICFWLLGCVALRAAEPVPGVPDTLTGRTYTLIDGGGRAFMSFMANNRYEFVKTNGVTELGYFFATRSGNLWKVAETTADGSLTTQYTFDFSSGTNGMATAVIAGVPKMTFTFMAGRVLEPNLAAIALTTLTVRNEVSATGPSTYTIQFTGTTNGTFNIPLPGYGFGTFVYAPGTNSARLTLTFAGDLTGDRDDLKLEFKAPSGSTTNSLQSGTQFVNGQLVEVRGTFNYVGVPL